MAELVLVRPGQTPWSRDGRHTGRTDVALTTDGEADARALAARLDACLVGHGHALRVLAACWLGLDPSVGQQLVLGAGSVSTLGHEHGCPAVLRWNTS